MLKLIFSLYISFGYAPTDKAHCKKEKIQLRNCFIQLNSFFNTNQLKKILIKFKLKP